MSKKHTGEIDHSAQYLLIVIDEAHRSKSTAAKRFKRLIEEETETTNHKSMKGKNETAKKTR